MPTNQLYTRYQRYFYPFLVGLLVLPMIVSREFFIKQEMTDKADMSSVTQPQGASSYNVYRSTQIITNFLTTTSLIGTFTTSNCADIYLPEGTYFYAVVARIATEFLVFRICVYSSIIS